MVVWVYAGGGQAEIGIVPWLQRHFPKVSFQRRTPQIRKPGPRPGVITKSEVVGQTGKDLDKAIRNDLKSYWQKNSADVLLLLDDTDCEAPNVRDAALRTAVMNAVVEDEIPCLAVALALPELEVWLLADWQSTFQNKYRLCQTQMRKKLKDEGVDFDRLEEFDCRCGTTEYRKISVTIRDAFEVCCEGAPRYSKATDTPSLLMQAEPNTIASRCPNFKTFWNELNSCLASVPQ